MEVQRLKAEGVSEGGHLALRNDQLAVAGALGSAEGAYCLKESRMCLDVTAADNLKKTNTQDGEIRNLQC